MAGRRTSLVSLAGQKVEDVPGRSDAVLLSVPLDKLHCTRFNPRRNFGTDEELKEFGEKLKKEQLQPAVVVSRAAYLKLWPNEADRVGSASYVVANGERRYRASQLVGRGVLEVVHREDVAKSRADFLDAVQSENNDRQNLDPIERAIAIETMVTELEGADRVAAYYSKTKGWVSQQRKLLKLTPDLQDLVSAGEMPVRVARDIAGLPPEVQAAAWDEEVQRRRLEKEAGARLRAQAANPPAPEAAPVAAIPAPDAPTRFTAVNQTPPEQPASGLETSGEGERFTAVNQTDVPRPAPPVRAGGEIPAQHPAAETSEPPRLPYDDGAFLARHLIKKMSAEEFDRMLDLLIEHRAKQAVDVG